MKTLGQQIHAEIRRQRLFRSTFTYKEFQQLKKCKDEADLKRFFGTTELAKIDTSRPPAQIAKSIAEVKSAGRESTERTLSVFGAILEFLSFF